MAQQPLAHAAGYWTILDAATDERGQDVPIRNGDASLGYTKACEKHNICNIKVIRAAISRKSSLVDQQGTGYVYLGHLVGSDIPDTQVRVVGDQGVNTKMGNTPDGRSVAVITAYCVGVQRCPDSINRATIR